MESSRDYLELIKSTFHGSESVETPEKLKVFLDDAFQSSPESYISLLTAVQNIIEAHNSVTITEHFDEIMQNFHSLSTQSKNLTTELQELKINEKALPAIYLSKNQHHHEETKQVTVNRENELKKEIQTKIDSITPLLQRAQDSICSLDKASINEISAFKNPPASVKFVCELVCTLFNHTQSCIEKRSCIRQMNFLNSLMCFDKDNISQATYNKVQKKIKEHPNITEESVKNTSKACLGLYIWATYMIKYYDFSKEIKALRAKLVNVEAEVKNHDEHKEETREQVEEPKKSLEPVHNYEVNNPELSKALAPIIDRENEIYELVQNVNKQISELSLIKEAIVYGLST